MILPVVNILCVLCKLYVVIYSYMHYMHVGLIPASQAQS